MTAKKNQKKAKTKTKAKAVKKLAGRKPESRKDRIRNAARAVKTAEAYSDISSRDFSNELLDTVSGPINRAAREFRLKVDGLPLVSQAATADDAMAYSPDDKCLDDECECNLPFVATSDDGCYSGCGCEDEDESLNLGSSGDYFDDEYDGYTIDEVEAKPDVLSDALVSHASAMRAASLPLNLWQGILWLHLRHTQVGSNYSVLDCENQLCVHFLGILNSAS